MSAELIIRFVNTHVLRADLSEPFAYSQAWYRQRGAMLVEIGTDQGITGWGEAFGPPELTAPVVQWLAHRLQGRDAMAVEAIWQDLYNCLRDHGRKGITIEAQSAIDIALWDIRGKALGLPIHRLMGGPLRSSVAAYATGMYRRERSDHLQYLRDEADAHLAEGFQAIKLKIGWGVEPDILMTQAMRSHVGPNVQLMADANHAYDALNAVKYARAVEHLDLAWFEEPVVPEDLQGYLQVKGATSIPIAGGEAEFTRWGHRKLLENRAVDILQPDVCACGGLTEAKRISDLASAFNVRCNPHVWGTAVGMAASLQWLAVIPDFQPALYPVQPLLEFDRSEHPLRDAVVHEPIRHVNGVVPIPTGPGLGIDIDRRALERFSI